MQGQVCLFKYLSVLSSPECLKTSRMQFNLESNCGGQSHFVGAQVASVWSCMSNHSFVELLPLICEFSLIENHEAKNRFGKRIL